MEDKCPWCGASQVVDKNHSTKVRIFDCWTKTAPGHINRGEMCYVTVVRALQELLEGAGKAYSQLQVILKANKEMIADRNIDFSWYEGFHSIEAAINASPLAALLARMREGKE